MTVAEAARSLGIPARTLRDRLTKGHIKGTRFSARVWLIPTAEVERLRGQGNLKTGYPAGRPRKPAEEQP